MDETNKKNPLEKKSIRNIPLTKKQAKELEKIEEEINEVPENVAPAPRPISRQAVAKKAQKSIDELEVRENRGKEKKRGGVLWWTAAALCLILIYGIAHYFRHATVSIVRAQETVVLSDDFAFASLASSTDDSSAIKYQKSTFNLSASTTVAANGQQTIQKKAAGKMVVYNDSSSAQLLIATTRFQSPEGLIFRLSKDITVPAKKNVTVDVTADQPGEKYNIGPKTFSLPALAGTAKGKQIYGKSGSSMTGGSVSTVPQTAASDLSAAKGVLQNKIIEDTATKAISEQPEGFVLVNGAIVIAYGDVKQKYDQTSKMAILNQDASVTVYYLEKSSLSKAVASKSTIFALSTSTANAMIDTVSLEAVIPNSKTLSSLTLNGTSTVTAALEPDSVASMLSGLSRSDAVTTIKAFPGIETVEVSIKPWWERKLPGADSIKVEIE